VANIFPDLTVQEHLELRCDQARTERVFELFPALRPLKKSHPDALSGGQLQRLAFSLALTHDFELYIFDEVTNHLDPATSGIVGETMRNLARGSDSVTVVFISHDNTFLRGFSDQIITFEEG